MTKKLKTKKPTSQQQAYLKGYESVWAGEKKRLKLQEENMARQAKYVSEHHSYVKRLVCLISVLGLVSELAGCSLIINNHPFIGFFLAGVLANMCVFYLWNINKFNAYKI